MEIRKTVILSMLLALSVVLSIIESFIPIFNGIIPGMKIGLANILIVYSLYVYGFKDTIFLAIFLHINNFLYSLVLLKRATLIERKQKEPPVFL